VTSKVTRRYGDRSAGLPQIARFYPGLDGTVLDGELFNGHFYAFDIPFHKGADLRQRPLRERRLALAAALHEMCNPLVIPVPTWASGIEAMFTHVTSHGGEGLVVKDLEAPYGERWAKMKKSYTVSCVVTALNPGAAGGSFTLSVYDRGALVEVGRAIGGNESFLGRVVDAFAQEVTAHGRLRHASFHRFRDDVEPEACTLDKLRADLKGAARTNRRR
jgi:ATP-dependent DNA ligase